MADEPATKTKPTTVAAEVAAEITEFEQTVEEFCSHLSITDLRVELIGAFHAVEKAAGRIKDLPSAFASRFAAFVNAPA